MNGNAEATQKSNEKAATLQLVPQLSPESVIWRLFSTCIIPYSNHEVREAWRVLM